MTDSIHHEIIHRWENGQSMRSIARSLGINRKRVARIVREHRSARDSDTPPRELPQPPRRRASKLDPFQEILQQLLERYPNITVVRMQEELQQAWIRWWLYHFTEANERTSHTASERARRAF